MIRYPVINALALPLLLLLSFVGSATAKSRTPVFVDGPRISAHDVLGKRVPRIDLGPAAPPGSARWVYLSDFRNRMGLKWAAAQGKRWRVVTRHRTWTCAAQRVVVATQLAALRARGIRIAKVRCPRPLRLPRGKITVASRLLPSSRWGGRRTLQLRLTVGDWRPRLMQVQVVLDGQISVAVVRRNLARRRRISADDVTFERRDANTVPADAVLDRARLLTHWPSRMLSRGSLLRAGDLLAVPTIQAGTLVTIRYKRGGLRIVNRGRALHDAARGQILTVDTLKGKRRIRARVVGPRLAEVSL